MDPIEIRVGARRTRPWCATCVVGCIAVTAFIACAEYVPPSTRDGSGGTSGSSGGTGATAGTSGATSGTGTGGTLSGSGGTLSGAGGTGATGGTSEASGGSSGASGSAGSAGSGGSGGGGVDACPDDPAKMDPGGCGCGVEEDPACASLKEALIHRYAFDGMGDAVTDSVGSAHGTVEGTTLDDSGDLTLAGTTTDQYVNLPNGLISGLENATLEIWFTWSGGGAWQRLFDFGSSDMAEGTQGDGQTYLFLTPRAVDANGFLRVAYTSAGNENEILVTATAAASTSPETHVTVVVDSTNDLLSLYQGSTLAGSAAFTETLAGLDDVNAWLGRSQYSGDPELGGTLHEFRIYDAALTAAEIGYSDSAGPDAPFLEP
jgi:hypothetical protein